MSNTSVSSLPGRHSRQLPPIDYSGSRTSYKQNLSIRKIGLKYSTATMNPNPYLLAADNSPDLLPLLRKNPTLASAQDEHGYSLIHAAASYNHLDLLRSLVEEFKVNIDLVDEDNETALFSIETVEAAKALIALGANINHLGSDGLTAQQKLEADADFPAVAQYLASLEAEKGDVGEAQQAQGGIPPSGAAQPPEGLNVTLGTMDESEEVPDEFDPEFRRRIEEFAQRDDFDTAQGQEDLRKLIQDAVESQGLTEERNVKSKQG